MNGKIYIKDFKKLVKDQNLEVMTVESLIANIKTKEFLKSEGLEYLDEIQKSEFNNFQEELQSYQKVEVLHDDLSKSVLFVRLPNVDWEEVEERGEFNEVLKARSGVYSNNAYNRKHGLVGKKFGGEKKSGGSYSDLSDKELEEEYNSLTSSAASQFENQSALKKIEQEVSIRRNKKAVKSFESSTAKVKEAAAKHKEFKKDEAEIGKLKKEHSRLESKSTNLTKDSDEDKENSKEMSRIWGEITALQSKK